MANALLSKPRSLVASLWVLGVLLAIPSPSHALVLSVDQPVRTSVPGATELFTGTITNDTGSSLTAQDLALNFSNFDPGALSFNQELGFIDFAIPDNTTTADVPLFTALVGLGATASGSPYLADVQLQDPAQDLSNIVTVSISVPEPGSAGLLLGGVLMLAAWVGLRGSRKGWIGRASAGLGLVALLPALIPAAAPAVRAATAGPVQMGTGPVGTSVWPDGTVSLAVPIVNNGTVPAADVRVTSISLRSLAVPGTRSDGAALPILLGPIAPDGQAVLSTRFSGLPYALSYLLTVSGTYTVSGGTPVGFSVNDWVSPSRSLGGVTPARQVPLVKQHTLGLPGPAIPILPELENNPGGPPVPVGPAVTLFPVPPTATPAVPEGSSASVVFYRDTGGDRGLPSIPPDPTAAAADAANVVLASGNSYLLVSTNGGATFTQIDPTTIFTDNPDGGLCCDQVITYVPSVNLFFWLLQYKDAAATAPSTIGANRLRIAWASPASVAANVYAWTYVDLTTGTFNLVNGAGVLTHDLDFPDLAFTNTFLYASVDTTKGAGSTQGLVVARMALATLADPAATTVGIGYISQAENGDMTRAFGSRLTQSSPSAMYWAGHKDTSNLEVFYWPDATNSVTAKVVTNSIYCNSDYTSLAPDNYQWLDNTRSSGIGAVIGATHKPSVGALGGPQPNGEVWFAWGAGRDEPGNPNKCNNGRPQPYVYIARVDDMTLQQVGEYDIWNASFAFAYPALATDPGGEIGVALAWGGPSNYGSTAAGYLGDFVVYYNEPSDGTVRGCQTTAAGTCAVDGRGNPIQQGTRFGDYFVVRNSGTDGSNFSSQGYAVKLTNPMVSATCGVFQNCTYHPHYIEWGRPPAPPIK